MLRSGLTVRSGRAAAHPYGRIGPVSQQPPARPEIYVSHLRLENFRNYERLELDLAPGMVLVEGENGHGKSNLVEALYLLAIGKSLRATTERELVRWQPPSATETYTHVMAAVEHDSGTSRVQVDFRSSPPAGSAAQTQGESPPAGHVQKYVRVNGAPRRASDLVGELPAVLFTAQDLDLVFGSPSVRRRYLDIMLSQLDRRYLRAAQRYQRVIAQRNQVLKAIAERRAKPDELEFWSGQAAETGGYMMAARARAIAALSPLSERLYGEMSGDGERCELAYSPSVEAPDSSGPESCEAAIRNAMEERLGREIAQGHTVTGPHRDDLLVKIGGMPAGQYASRGQGRTAVLAMKLAEAENLRQTGPRPPVLLLDDVLSELDAGRRAHVLDQASAYRQAFITTADPAVIDPARLPAMTRFEVTNGVLSPA